MAILSAIISSPIYLNPPASRRAGPCGVGHSVDQVGRCHALGHAVSPAARLHQVVQQQRNNVVRLDKRAIAVQNAEAVRIAVGRDADRRAHLLHLFLRVAQQVVVGLWRMSAEEHVAVVVNRLHSHARLAQQSEL